MYTASWMVVTLRRHPVKDYIEELQAKMKEIGVGEIATVIRTLLCNGS